VAAAKKTPVAYTSSCKFLSFPEAPAELTEDPIQSCWAHLGLFAAPDFVNSFLAKKHGGTIRKQLADETASFMRQARYLFGTAQHATLESKPLLLYYGQLNLAKATIALSTAKLPEPSHGLKSDNKVVADSMRSWAAHFRPMGIAPRLASAFGFHVKADTKFSLWDLLRRDAGCSTIMWEAFGPKRLSFLCSRLQVCPSYGTGNGRLRHGGSFCDISAGNYTLTEIQQCFGRGAAEGSHNYHCFVPRSKGPRYGLEHPSGAYSNVSLALPGQDEWSPLVIRQFATGFILSEIARYRPDLLAFPSGQNGRLIPVLDVAMRQIQRTFPNECLNHIVQRRVVFGSLAAAI
jgi:hypothetical protein